MSKFVPVLTADLDWLLRCGKLALKQRDEDYEYRTQHGESISPSQMHRHNRNRRKWRRVLRAFEEATKNVVSPGEREGEADRLAADLAAARAERDELAKALRGVSKSVEAHMYLNDPPADENMDEYDYMMKPLWEAALAALPAPPEQEDDNE